MPAAPGILIDHAGSKGVGDIICELPVYDSLRQQFPTARLYSRNSRSLAWGHPEIAGFDQTSPPEAFDRIVHLADLTKLVKDYRTALEARHSVFQHFQKHLGFDGPTAPPELYVLPSEMEALGLEDDGTDGLIIAYSTDSKDFDRRWGEERFIAFLQHLEATYDISLIELGSGLSSGHTGLGLDLVGQTSIRQSMAVLSLADLFIGNHGGLTHMAGGIGTPILSPWGASTPYPAYVYDDLSVAIETAPLCRHCTWTGERIPECLKASFMFGRSPCTQAISVDQMIEAADRLIPRLQQERARLREAKAARRLRAQEPRLLECFEIEATVSPYSRQYLTFGGAPGWGNEHSLDNLSRLETIVAFPDWLGPKAVWRDLLAAYIAQVEATDDRALLLSAFPLTGPEVKEVLETFISHLKPTHPVPKIAIILGHLEEAARLQLIERASAYVPLESGYHVPADVYRGATPYLERWAKPGTRALQSLQ